ncbi:MAG: response regulator [Desulfurivibrionaceae bacterium]
MVRDMRQQDRRILVVDDDRDVWKAYRLVLTPESGYSGTSAEKINRLLTPEMDDDPAVAIFSLSFAAQGQEGVAMVQEAVSRNEPFALAFIDVRMPPGWDGMETAKRIRALDPEIELVIVTAYSDRSIEEIVRAVGSSEKLLFLRKPFDPDELRQLALSLTAKWALARLAEKQRKDLAVSEYRFRSLVETTSDFVWEVDREGRFLYCSPICRDLYEYAPEELLGKHFFTVLDAPENQEQARRIFDECVASGSHFRNVENTCLTKSGTSIIIESSGTPVFDERGQVCGYRGIDRDITGRKANEAERQRLETRLRQSQKMEAIGTLAGGIAHDFNNILSPILGYTELALTRISPHDPLAADLQQVIKGAMRAKELVLQILAISRQSPKERKPLQPHLVVKEALKLLRASLPSTIEIREDISTECGAILADPTQLHQIIMNLSTNAYHAMRETGGVLGVSLAEVTVGEEDSKVASFELEPGDYVLLEISDTGCGMDQATLARIFEPYFTTKAMGEGTGLGLSVVHGIVKSHHGQITVYSEPGRGTKFNVYLPRAAEENILQIGAVCRETIPTGTERLLVVDDEEMITGMLMVILQNLGYQITISNSSLETLDLLEHDPAGFDLLITDLTMPGLTGFELSKKVLAIRPDLPVILCTGFSELINKEQAQAMGIRAYLMKPVSVRELAQTVRKVLDEK